MATRLVRYTISWTETMIMISGAVPKGAHGMDGKVVCKSVLDSFYVQLRDQISKYVSVQSASAIIRMQI